MDVVLDPELFEAIEAGDTARMERWLVAEGDRVDTGELIGQARAARELVGILAPHGGILEQILVAAGERFVPGHALARIVEF